MPELSIIVPLNSDLASFEDTLASVLRHQPEDSELLVIHDGSYEDPHDLEYEGVKFLQIQDGESQIGAQLRATTLADSPVVHFLQPGTEVDEGWCAQPLELFGDAEVASVSPVLVFDDEPAIVATLGVGYSKTFRPLLVGYNQDQQKASRQVRRVAGSTRWAGFYRTDLLKILHLSVWELNDEIADLQLALSFEKLGLKHCVAADSLIQIDHRLDIEGEIRSVSGAAIHETHCLFTESNHYAGLGTRLKAMMQDWIGSRFSPTVVFHSFSRFFVDSEKVASDFRIAWDSICWEVRDLNESESIETPIRRAA